MSVVDDSARVASLPSAVGVAGAFALALGMMALFSLATLGLVALGTGGGPGR